MSQPYWVTPAGDLGTIPEGVYYATPLIAQDPVTTVAPTIVTNSNGVVTFTFVAQSSIVYPLGTTIIVSGFTPSGYNGEYEVIRTSKSSVGVINATTAAVTVFGTITNVPVDITFEVIAGSLPAGIAINENGVIGGTPQPTIGGVPADIAVATTSRFAIRARNASSLADRTFSLTVAVLNQPYFVTPAGNIGYYINGQQIFDLQVDTYNPDIYGVTIVRLVAGALPPGLTISTSGVISGVVGLNPEPLLNYDYEFTLEVSNGESSNLRTFNIFVYARHAMSADTTLITADDTHITADVYNVATPVITTPAGSIGTVRTGNFFAFQFTGEDINYPPRGLEFSNVPDALVQAAANVEPQMSQFKDTLILGRPLGDVTDSGTVTIADATQYDRWINGLSIPLDQTEWIEETMNPYMLANPDTYADYTSSSGFQFVGTNLPPGLTLDPNSGWLYGLIPNNGSIDITTYDFEMRVQDITIPELISPPYLYSLTINGPILGDIIWNTPSDLGTIINGSTSTLYVEATSVSGLVVQYQLAGQALGSDPVYNLLPQGLQFLSSGHIVGRVSFDTFALDSGTTTFDRSTTTFDMVFTFTVNAFSTNGLINALKTFSIRLIREFDEPYDNLYIQAMPPLDDRSLLNSLLQNDNIFPPNLIYRLDDPNFGIARQVVYQHAFGLTAATYNDYIASLNINHYWKNLVLGEIKTAQALDDLGNVIYEVVYSQVVDNLVNNDGESVGKSVTLPYIVDSNLGLTQTVYPNSLINMRDQVIDTVGQISNMLPRWMLSKQADGAVLGFTPAWVIAYTVPGQSGQIAYNIETQFGIDRLNLVDFEVDRYELDNLLTKNWNRAEQHWTPRPPTLTRFDFSTEQAQWINNLNPASILPWINDLGSTVAWSYGTPPGTTFDQNSLQFTAPVDMYSSTTAYDQYLLFPRRNIIGPVGSNPLSFVPWTEDGIPITWVDAETGETVVWTALES
jgi:hypothetical protein